MHQVSELERLVEPPHVVAGDGEGTVANVRNHRAVHLGQFVVAQQ